MKAAFIEETGAASNIRYGELPVPQPEPTQVLVRVGAVAVNPIDTYIRAGAIPMAIPKPYIVGCDLAGVVESVGSDVERFRPGQRVWGSNQSLFGRQGTFAEFAAVDECWLYPTPEEVEDTQAAAMALVGITAHLGLFLHARLHAGETVFVTGGSGGVGSAVIQMAKAAGARVITTAGSEAKAAKCREFGADRVILYQHEEIGSAIREFAPAGVSLWWEVRRAPDFDFAVPLLERRGRFVLMAGRDARPVFPAGPFYVKDCHLCGFAMFNASPDEQRASAQDMNRWMASGKLNANICHILPLSDTANAHQLQEESTVGLSGGLSGKIVLKP